MRQAGLFGLLDQLKRLSDCGDPLETMGRVVNFEVFRPALEKALAYGDGTRGGRPPYDPVAMFKILILQAQHNLSDARTEFMIRDRLSWMRFLGFSLGDRTPEPVRAAADDDDLIRERLLLGHRRRLSPAQASKPLP